MTPKHAPRDQVADDGPTAHPQRSSALRAATALRRYLQPYRGRIIVGMGTLFGCSLLRLLFPFIAGAIIDAASERGSASVPLLGELSFAALALLAGISVAFHALGSFITTLLFNRVGQSALADLRTEVYGRLIRLPLSFHKRRRVGELTSRVSLDIAQIEGALTATLPQVCLQAVFILGAVTLFAVTSGRLAWLIVLFLPAALGAAAFFGRRLRRSSCEVQDRLAEANTVAEETLHAITSVKTYTNESLEQERFRRANDRVLTAAVAAARWRAAFGAFFVAAIFGCLVLVLWFGAELLHRGEITAGELTRLLLYLIFVAGAVSQAADLFNQLQRAAGAIQRVGELLREPTEVSTEAPAPAALPTRIQGAVVFDAVTFHYPDRPEVPVLRGVTLAAKPGERIALVGHSGAGKSTLTHLLLRLYVPDTGRVLLDGRDARDYPLAWLRAQCAIVPQDVVLFGGTIFENIAYGKPGATEAEVRAAAAQANADEFVLSFPEGYQTLVGDRGAKLSGGQRQRIAIARAILKDPAILILDEATNSLDSESEQVVQGALARLMRGRTSFVIAHRFATVRNADLIAVFQDGRMVESGTHEQLDRIPGGIYRQLGFLQTEAQNSGAYKTPVDSPIPGSRPGAPT